MRNLVILNDGKFRPSSDSHPGLQLYMSSFDTLTDSITCVFGAADIGAIEVHRYAKDGSITRLASFCIQTYDDILLSFAHFADLNQLVFVFAQGDIMTATYDIMGVEASDAVVEIVGTIDNGIEAAEWSYDEETLALVTKERTLVLLSRQFEAISETPLAVEDLKMSKHVTVGWGKKETQFRGKGARAMEREALVSLKASGLVGNELRDPTMPYMVDSGIITEKDDRSVTISWRGDCEYFAVTTIENIADPDDDSKMIERRALRVYTREGQLDSASEPVDGLEHNMAWKPQGSLIATVRRLTHIPEEEALEIVFFERNGLRHGEFNTRLPVSETITFLGWNCSSDVLAIGLTDRIQLWTTKNYHWYLKQEIYATNLSFVKWHPEKELNLMYGEDGCVHVINLSFKMTAGPTLEPHDQGTSLVIDGNTVNITPFSIASVPPPMYYREFEAPSCVLDAATSLSNELYASLTKDALVLASVPSLSAMRTGEHPVIVTVLPKDEFASEFDTLRQVAFLGNDIVGVLLDSENLSRIAMVDVKDILNPVLLRIVDIFTKVVLLRSSVECNSLVYETIDNRIVQLDFNGAITEIVQFPQLVSDFRVKTISMHTPDNSWKSDSSKLVAFGLTANGILFANNVQLTTAVTSIEVTGSLLLFTTAQHYLQMVHLNTTSLHPLPPVEGDIIDERIRAIERGSILVNVNPSRSAVILQAPRGNLETFHPRIMILTEVRKNILSLRYRYAFMACRTHRISLDILHDYSPELFFNNLKTFIDQIEKVDYLNLFVSCLTEEDVSKTKYKETINITSNTSFDVVPPPPTEMELYIRKKAFDPNTSKVNKICKAILSTLLDSPVYRKKYLQTIITAYACQNPANILDALSLIGQLQDEDTKDSSITYLCFLEDVKKVYKVALSLYDVNLSLAVAQKSQIDPREYLPFLQRLNDSEEIRRKFIIDDYLENYVKSLQHLASMNKNDESISEEFLNYVCTHDLYKEGLRIYRNERSKQNAVYEIYANYLASRQEYVEAGIVYEMLGKWREAMDSYTSGNKWAEAMTIATQYFSEEIVEVAETLVASLTAEHNYLSAAQLELKFLKNYTEAINLYCKAYYYDEAILICYMEKRPELIPEVVDPALGEGFSVVAELLADCKGQVNSQLKRLRELRSKKEEDPYAFYGEETDQADDVSIAPSDTSTKESFFTRYTGKTSGTAKTGASRRTAKNKRREERKRARGKKGTIYEEEYLVKSIGRLIERLDHTRLDAVRLIDGLLRRHMREQAYHIQKSFIEVITLLKENVVEIYTISEKDRERIDENGAVYYLPEVSVPTISDFTTRDIIDY